MCNVVRREKIDSFFMRDIRIMFRIIIRSKLYAQNFMFAKHLARRNWLYGNFSRILI